MPETVTSGSTVVEHSTTEPKIKGSNQATSYHLEKKIWPDTGWLNKSSSQGSALGVTKFITTIAVKLVTPGACTKKLIKAIIYGFSKKARASVSGKPLSLV